MNTIKDSIAIRQKINRQIVGELTRRVEEEPNMRFGQIISDILPNWRKKGIASADDLLSILRNEEPAIHLARLTEHEG